MSTFQGIDARTERRADGRQVADQPHYGPWLNTADAADYLRYTGKHPLLSVYKFIKRHGIVVRHDGRRVLLARADVDRALEDRDRLSHGGAQLRATRPTSATTLKGI